MKKTIKRKIFIHTAVLIVLLITLIGISTKLFLPSFYMNNQLKSISDFEEDVRSKYVNKSPHLAASLMREEEDKLGGRTYFYDKKILNKHGQKQKYLRPMLNFDLSKDIESHFYKNKVGMDIYFLGIKISEDASEYFIYELAIQTLTLSQGVVVKFMIILLAIAFIIGIIVSEYLSRRIARPVKNLTNLAEQMRKKQIEPTLVTRENDEILELNMALNELYDELKNKIFQLNSELKREKNSEKLKKRFLAQATHELKTPVAIISGYSEILYDGMYKDMDEHDKYLKLIYETSQNISKLILDVLEYVKIETGNYSLKLENTKISDYLKDIINEKEAVIYTNGKRLEKILNIDEKFYLKIDRLRYRQIFDNLIYNAIEYSKTLIRIEVEGANGKLKMSIFNDGQNIDENEIPFIFDSFYKSQNNKNGTGLGLAIVKELVILHGGTYRVENIDGGVKFTIII